MTMRARETFHFGSQTETGGTLRPDDDPLVAAFPGLYEPVEDAEPAAPRRGRPPGSKNKPKPDADA